MEKGKICLDRWSTISIVVLDWIWNSLPSLQKSGKTAFDPSKSCLTSHKSASTKRVIVIGKIMLFDQLRDLRLRVTFCVFDNLAVPLLIRTSFLNKFVKSNFLMKWLVVPIRSRPVPFIFRYMSAWDMMSIPHKESDAKTIPEDWKDCNVSTPLFRSSKYIATSSTIEPCVSVTTSNAVLSTGLVTPILGETEKSHRLLGL